MVIFKDLLIERVAEGVAFDPHDVIAQFCFVPSLKFSKLELLSWNNSKKKYVGHSAQNGDHPCRLRKLEARTCFQGHP